MKRILVFAEHDWTSPRAGPSAHYLHRVLTELARQGHYTAVVSQQGPPWTRRKRRAVEVVDGVQLARIGFRAVQNWTSRTVLTRMMRQEKMDAYDAVLDGLPGAPLARRFGAGFPVIPLVFERCPRNAMHLPEGPILLTTAHATAVLGGMGIPGNALIHAPFAPDGDEPGEGGGEPRGIAAAARNSPRLVRLVRAAAAGPVTELRVMPGMPFPADALDGTEALGVCLPGAEYAAIDFARRGVVPVLPDTTWGTALATELGLDPVRMRRASLAGALDTALDSEARARTAARLQTAVRERSWATTASLVLATVENLAVSG
jgi:hypothetical protein